MHRWKWLDSFGGTIAFLLVLAAGSCAVWLLLSEGLQPTDPAYLQFRHARNLAAHGRLSFNAAGQPVLATEAPGYVAVLAAGSFLFRTHNIDRLALSLNAFFLLWIIVFSFLIAKDLLGAIFPAVLTALLMTLHSSVIAIFASGFEQAMLLSDILGAFYLLSKRRYASGCLLVSLAPLIALEGIVALCAAFIFLLMRRSKVRYFAIVIAAPVVWTLFSVYYYGSAVPQSLMARFNPLLFYPYQSVWQTSSDWLLGYPYYAALNCVTFHRLLFSGSFNELHFGVMEYARVIVALSAFFYWISTNRKGAHILLFPLLFFLLVPFLKAQHRSMIPCVAFGILFYFFVCCVAWRQLIEIKSGSSKKFLEIGGYVGLFLLFQTGSRYEFNPWADPILKALDPRVSEWVVAERQQYNSYRRAAEYLKKRAGVNKIVLAHNAGFFGYAYRGDIFDSSGYCTPAARQFYPPQPSDLYDETGWRFTRSGMVVPAAMIEAVRADYIVATEAAMKRVLKPNSTFWLEYSHLTRAGLVWGSWLSIYERRALSAKR